MKEVYPSILWEAYEQFMLNFEGKKIPTPYRINDISNPHAVGPEFRGKSSPEVLIETTYKIADELGFNLSTSSSDMIREFMKCNLLGIDCSGYAYRCLDYLALKVKGLPLTELGFEHVGRTNVRKLSDDEHSIPVSPDQIHPADIIKTNSGDDILHVLLIMEISDGEVIYTHSSSQTKPQGVHIGSFSIGENGTLLFNEFLGDINYCPDQGDGIRRLRALI